MHGDSARVWGCVPRKNRRITFSGIAGKRDTGEMSQHNAKEKEVAERGKEPLGSIPGIFLS